MCCMNELEERDLVIKWRNQLRMIKTQKEFQSFMQQLGLNPLTCVIGAKEFNQKAKCFRYREFNQETLVQLMTCFDEVIGLN